jgi:hypothetical protein
MSILLGTLCLNEMEWLPNLYEQHKNWPELQKWVFVESADIVYAQTNPTMVSSKGLSTDGTSEFLTQLATKDSRVVYIPYGFSKHKIQDQGKCAARQQYLEQAEIINPDFVFVVDADEFYTFEHQKIITDTMESLPQHKSFCFSHIHPWRPPSISEQPLFSLQITEGFWRLGFVRGWRWESGNCYLANHNHIENSNGENLKEWMADFRRKPNPCCVHMGFCASLKTRQAKHRYYKARGEGSGDGRDSHILSRKAFEIWSPGDSVYKATIGKYTGPIPECFR